jgi:hypothetical protein
MRSRLGLILADRQCWKNQSALLRSLVHHLKFRVNFLGII